MGFWDSIKKAFKAGEEEHRRPRLTEEEKRTAVFKVGPQDKIDPTVDPIDNPMDYREDGSIREGDPMWDMMQRVLKGETAHGRQREDGTWDIQYRNEGD